MAASRLFLIDGMALVYRSYYAFIKSPMMNSRGENTGLIYGFVNFLNRLLESQQPDQIAVVFDTAAPTFRHEMYGEYKATRQKMPEDMSSMLGILKDVIRAYNIAVLELPGFEADDVIGTLAVRHGNANHDVFIVSSDKDLMQLINSHVKMYRPGKQGGDDEIIDESGVVEKFGIPPLRVIDYLSLTGDSSDNIPGVPGIGPKSALPLIQKYQTLENVYKHLEEIPQKGIREKLAAHKELAFQSKKLVTIETNCPIEASEETLILKQKNFIAVRELFSRLEFRSFLKSLDAAAPPPAQAPEIIESGQMKSISTVPHTYEVITSDQEYLRLLSALKKSKSFVFDTETTSARPLEAELVGISFAVKPFHAWYLPVEYSDQQDENEGNLFSEERASGHFAVPLERLRRDIQPLFADKKITKIGQNVKYDALVLGKAGVEVHAPIFDTMIASYILRADGKHSLDSLAKEHLQYSMISFEQLTENGTRDIRSIPVSEVGDYSAEDADITCQLADILHNKLSVLDMMTICTEIEFPLVLVLANVEAAGAAIDIPFLKKMSVKIKEASLILTESIYSTAGETFNINSTQQLAHILFEKLGLTPLRKTKTGFSTDVAVLEALRASHPIIDILLEYRQLSKLQSTYIDALPSLADKKTKRVHTTYNQTVTSTGRLSSSDPNLQNIPIRTELGREVRRAFVRGSKENLIISADYSQIELRVMAHMSKDEGLIEAFRQGEDIHTSTAAKVFGIPADEVTRDMRRKAKEVNFGIMYGIGPYGLSTRLGISQSEARGIISRYFERFPGVNRFISETLALAKSLGYVSTLIGRRRYIPDINSRNGTIRANAERQAINMPIQGTAADMIKLAMVRIEGEFRRNTIRSKMVMQVHDELVFDVINTEEEQVSKIIEKQMKEALPLSVPIELEIGRGSNWLEAHQ